MRAIGSIAVLGMMTAIAAALDAAAGENARVEGYAKQPVRERLDRGLVAVRTEAGQVYVGWRLLRSDPGDVAFHVYRRSGQGQAVRLNAEPIRRTTDYLDASPPKGAQLFYSVRAVAGGREDGPAAEAALAVSDPRKPYLTIPLEGNYTFQKVGIADLDGDGRYDFVIKQPNANIDPYEKEGYWRRSPDTYKVEAYRHDGKLLWRLDLGWAIERGIWYSPYVVYDLDGDGKAEVALKTGVGDPRDKDGRVQSGPEYLTILDGLTGKPRAQVDWPSRSGFAGPGAYNYAARNQICVAYLDGKTPCLVVERGTYNFMTAVAHEFHGGKLRELWRWDNRDMPRQWRGQGAHWMHAADIDGDGRDEVLLGSSVLDDNGKPLWTTGLGHPDHFYVGDLDPSRPGLEVYYGIEPRSKKNSMCMVDAKTGRVLWGYDQPTQHVHSSGLCSDIDAAHPGAECYAGERDFKDKRWLWDCKGKLLSNEDLGGLSPRAAYWDSDAQRELLVGSRIAKYHGPTLAARIEGSVIAVADVLGDWREEIITSVAGELRIYTTTIPAADRRVCLVQDALYRMDVVCAAMGYYQVPMLSYDVATHK